MFYKSSVPELDLFKLKKKTKKKTYNSAPNVSVSVIVTDTELKCGLIVA